LLTAKRSRSRSIPTAFERTKYADTGVHVNTCENHASLTRRWLSPHRGVSKDELTQYFRAFQYAGNCFGDPVETLSNTLFERRCEINNVLRMSV